MYIQHSAKLRAEHPALVAGAIYADGITADVSVDDAIEPLEARARAALGDGVESDLPPIQAWRRGFARMGLKPTQYRCAAESLLRRFRRDGSLPHIHPLIDLCNAVSLAYAIPVGVFDLRSISGWLEVRHATGEETYVTFTGEEEHPEPGEIIFADAEGRAHARRWTNRQSGFSAVRPDTSHVLIIAEALHDSATADIPKLVEELSAAVRALWQTTPHGAILSNSAPRFDFEALLASS